MSDSMRDLVILVSTGLLGGGLVSAVAALIQGRATARKTDVEGEVLVAKLPAEVDSVVVQGAEAAVLTMKSALESAEKRIESLEGDRAEDRKRIGELEAKVKELEAKVRRAEDALGEARDAGASLRRELAEFARERDTRRP